MLDFFTNIQWWRLHTNIPTNWRGYTRYNNADGIVDWALWKGYTLLKSVFGHDNSLWIHDEYMWKHNHLKYCPRNKTKHLPCICFENNAFMKNGFCLFFGIFVCWHSCENWGWQVLIWSLNPRTLLPATLVIMWRSYTNVWMIKNRRCQ